MPKRITVVGDVILDKYTHGTRMGISAETPTVVARLGKKEKFLGGAGLVTRHLLRLGCDVNLMTVVGPGEDVWEEMQLSEGEAARFFSLPMKIEGWKMPVKHRFFVDDYKMVQYDILNEGKWPPSEREVFFEHFRAAATRSDAVIICDNRHGVMDEALARCMVELPGRPVLYADSQVSQKLSNHHWYAGADFIMMNERELDAVISPFFGPHIENRVQAAGENLKSSIVLKLGAEGSLARLSDATYYRNHPPEVRAVDTCGAGDAFLAALVASEKNTWEGRLQDANNWAARSTTYKGTIVPEVYDEAALSR
jgi:bifunctional ADP-heptose synthase (sugar kinase/adenylyltransferase)